MMRENPKPSHREASAFKLARIACFVKTPVQVEPTGFDAL